MDATVLKMERSEARELYEKYRASLHFGEEIDREVARAYRLLAQGKLIIKAFESVRTAGLNEDGLPKLAILHADAKSCHLTLYRDGAARFEPVRWARAKSTILGFPSGTFAPPETSFPLVRPWRSGELPGRSSTHEAQAVVPIVPLHMRPKHALSNYHILWEADWHAVPRDPYLLRRLGKGDLWLVVAMWDLTEVERAALQARV